MYSKSFYITPPVGNNALSFEKRENKRLYVPSLIKIDSFDGIKIGKEVVFEDFDFDDKLQSSIGLENFYEIDYKGKKLYLFDNHNHAYFFWYLGLSKNLITKKSLLIHIDEHADTRDPGVYLQKSELDNLDTIFDYTNFTLNVGNYIVPAEKDGLIEKVIQVRSETNIIELNENLGDLDKYNSIILNIDLDFFEPALDYIDYNLKKSLLLDLIPKAKIITVATSPFFIDQDLALKVFKDIFK